MSTKSIPIDFVASVTPAVVSAGGDGVDVVGLLLTTNTTVPVGSVESFATPDAVADYFGSGSPEYAFAVKYFAGYDSSPQKPAVLRMAQFPLAGVPPYLQGGALATALSALTALAAGTIKLTVNGSLVTSGSVNLSTATSYSDVAARVQTALNYADASFTGSITGNVLTVSAIASGALAVGQPLSDLLGNTPAGATIVSQLTGTAGGVGTYQLSVSAGAPVASQAWTSGKLLVTYSSQLDAFTITLGTPGTTDTITVAQDGTIATALKLTAATGAEVSAGSAAAVPATFMEALSAANSDWVSFTTLWEPTTTLKQQFAAWTTGKNSRYAYVLWSTESQDIDANANTGTFYALSQAQADGTYYTYAPVNGALKAAFIMGAAASIDFNVTAGRRNFAYLTQAGLEPDVSDLTVASVLRTKGINFYARLSGTKTSFNRELPGAVLGKFLWMDSYVNQVWLNDALKTALFGLLANSPNIPYTTSGYGQINEALSAPIEAALTFGAIQAGVTLSESQASQVNTRAGVRVSDTLERVGWALVIQPASPAVRAARTSPPILFFYTDGGSVQSLNLTSTEVQ